MTMTDNTSTIAERWLICEISSQFYAMAVEHVTELVPINSITMHRPPCPPPHVEGVVDLRGEPIAVVDMRSVLGMTSMRKETEDILEMLQTREEDHVKWLNELALSVEESREFRLATDPHKCGFGIWYDNLMADKEAVEYFTNGDLALRDVLEQFDMFHQRIHGIAKHVTDLSYAGKTTEAQALIEETKDGDLASMIELFEKARELIVRLRRGVIVVLDSEDGRLGAMVDAASEVRRIKPEEFQTVGMLQGTDSLVRNLVQDDENERLIQLLDTRIIHEKCLPEVPDTQELELAI